jgi:hypothetical protein
MVFPFTVKMFHCHDKLPERYKHQLVGRGYSPIEVRKIPEMAMVMGKIW